MRIKNKNFEKTKAASRHLLISMLFGVGALLLIYQVWYPGVLAKVMHIFEIVVILLVVNILMGPLLTYIIFDSNKKNLKLDLSIIVLLQVLALFIGLYYIYLGRPAWLVFVEDRFEVVRYADVDAEYLKDKTVNSSFWSPQWAAVPLMNKERKDVLFSEVLKGLPDVAFRPNAYKKPHDIWGEIRSRAFAKNDLEKFNSSDAVVKIAEVGGEIRWLPLSTPAGLYVIAVGVNEGDLKILDLKGERN